MNKMPHLTDLEALADRVEALSGPDRDVDMNICIALNTGRSMDPRDPGARHYTGSLDAAMTLYSRTVDNIPTCPRKATAEALRALARDKQDG